MEPPYTLQLLLQYFVEPFDKILARISSRSKRYWLFIVIFVAVAVTFLLRTPPYGEMLAFPATPYGKAITWWLGHPFSTVPIDVFFPPTTINEGDNAGCASHCDKLAFRATLPLLNQVVGGGVWTLVGASNLAALSIFILFYQLILSKTKDSISACYATWALSSCYAGRYGFSDFICGDAVAVALLLGAMLARQVWLIVILILLASFTDERSLLVSPLVALYHLWKEGDPFQAPLTGNSLWKFPGASLSVILAIFAYGMVRVSISLLGHVHAGTSGLASTTILRFNYYQAPPVRLIDAFGGLWLIPIFFTLSLIAVRGWRSSSLGTYLALMGLAASPAFLVWDFERSLCYLLPGIVLSVCLLPFERCSMRTLLGMAMASSLLWSLPGSRLSVIPEYIIIRLHHLMSIL